MVIVPKHVIGPRVITGTEDIGEHAASWSLATVVIAVAAIAMVARRGNVATRPSTPRHALKLGMACVTSLTTMRLATGTAMTAAKAPVLAHSVALRGIIAKIRMPKKAPRNRMIHIVWRRNLRRQCKLLRISPWR